jgi:hypothetical protein
LGYTKFFEMRVPDHAAVDATVELARAVAGEGKASYINAILRAILREPRIFLPLNSLYRLLTRHGSSLRLKLDYLHLIALSLY